MPTWAMTRRLLLVVLGLGACGGPSADDSGDADTDSSGDTDASTAVQWSGLKIATSASLYTIHVADTQSWVAGTGGQAWTVQGGIATPLELTGSDVDLNGSWGTADNTVVLVVGSSGTVLESVAGDVVETDLGTATFQDVDGSSTGEITAVGWGGVYDRVDTGEWQFVEVPGSYRLSGVHLGESGAPDIAVGDAGVVLLRDGGTWSEIDIGTDVNLNGIHGIAANDVWVVGDGGFVAHFDGTTWTEFESGTEATLWGVWQSPTGQVFAVGNNGVAIWKEGEDFRPLPTGTIANLYTVGGTSALNVWAAGSGGQVLWYDGPQ